jgi:hypothetical protein
VLESRRFDDTNSTVYVVSVCGRVVELEERVYSEDQVVARDEVELLAESLSQDQQPPADVLGRASWKVREACERRAEPALKARWAAAPPTDLADQDRLRVSYEKDVLACTERLEPRYLGSDVDGEQGRRRYWFVLGPTVYFVSHQLGRPTCDHYLREKQTCPL